MEQTEAGSELFPGLMQRRQGLRGHCLLFAPHQTQRQKINAAAFAITHKFTCTHTNTPDRERRGIEGKSARESSSACMYGIGGFHQSLSGCGEHAESVISQDF